MPIQLQNEISEVFDKLHHVNENDSTTEVTDMVDSGESLKPVLKAKPGPRKLNNGIKSTNIEEWSSLAQFEKLIKLEMENLAATKNHQQPNDSATSVSTKTNNNNILKPEKHVRVIFLYNSIRFCFRRFSIKNYNHTPESRMENISLLFVARFINDVRFYNYTSGNVKM